MDTGLQIFGPTGALWLDSNRKTTRIMGIVTIVAAGSVTTVSVPTTGSAKIWAFTYATKGGLAYLSIDDVNSTLTYGPAVSPWPTDAEAYVFWGVS